MKEICGDVQLTFIQKLQYLCLNIPRGLTGYLVFLKSTHKTPRIVLSDISLESPTRHLLDRVFAEVIQAVLQKKTITVFDIGCGTGYVRDVLSSFGYEGSYTGIDMVRESKYVDSHNAFLSTMHIGDVTTYKSDGQYDLVISMTVLEHVIDDVAAIKTADRLVKIGGAQIHIVPMFPTIFLYLWHGYRQYNKRRLKLLFGQANTFTQYYRVGGLGSFVVHWFWITLPERLLGIGSLRRKFPGLYKRSLYVGFKTDYFLPFLATAYIIVKRNK